jgi:release factor glutamine methyltransferase
MFRKIVKKAQEITIKPLVMWYLKKERRFTYEGFKMTVFPGVFHPLLFHSSLILAKYLKKLPLKGKSFLEAGSGSGFISVLAAHYGAEVTALDLNPLAVKNTLLNAETNSINLMALQSDLFAKIPKKEFDYIFINPPYYPRKAGNDAQLAWFCGENFEYFRNLFQQMHDYYGANSQVIMILSEDCNLKEIEKIAESFQQSFELIETRSVFLEKNYLFRILKS